MLDRLTIAVPTQNSAEILPEALDNVSNAAKAADVNIRTLLIADGSSTDDTITTAQEYAANRKWNFDATGGLSLPKAREWLCRTADTEWLLFVDDDARLDKDYLTSMKTMIAPGIGGIQGRRHHRDEPNADWTRREARRGDTNGTLVRTEAVESIDIPSDLSVWEDHYIRRYIESQGYAWVFNHQATYSHENQWRHPIGWTEGYCVGKYDLAPGYIFALNVPYALLTGRNPIPHAKRAVGWVVGKLS